MFTAVWVLMNITCLQLRNLKTKGLLHSGVSDVLGTMCTWLRFIWLYRASQCCTGVTIRDYWSPKEIHQLLGLVCRTILCQVCFESRISCTRTCMWCYVCDRNQIIGRTLTCFYQPCYGCWKCLTWQLIVELVKTLTNPESCLGVDMIII